MNASPTDPAAIAPALAGTRLAALEIGPVIGAGSHCIVHAAAQDGCERALKVYKPKAVARHAQRNALPLAQYEFTTNGIYQAFPALKQYVAEPIDFLVTPTLQFFLQERLWGPLYYFWYLRASEPERARMYEHINRMVEEAHRAHIYGINIQSLNIIVVTGPDQEPIPRLFDFNRVPRHVHHSNRFLGLAVKLGLLSPRRLDYMTLGRFHDFRSSVRRIRKYGIRE